MNTEAERPMGALAFDRVGAVEAAVMNRERGLWPIGLALVFGIFACSERAPPQPERPENGPTAAEVRAWMEARGYRPLPASCRIVLPVTTAETAVCVVLSRVGADLERSKHFLMYFARKTGDEWEVFIHPAATVLGGGYAAIVAAESGAIIELVDSR